MQRRFSSSEPFIHERRHMTVITHLARHHLLTTDALRNVPSRQRASRPSNANPWEQVSAATTVQSLS